MQFRYQQLKSCFISGLCIACLFPGSKERCSLKQADWLNWCFCVSSWRQRSAGGRWREGGWGGEREGGCSSGLYFLSLFVNSSSKGPVPARSNDTLAVVFHLGGGQATARSVCWHPGSSHHSAALGRGGWRGCEPSLPRFCCSGKISKESPCFIFCLKNFLARNHYNNCICTCPTFCHVVFVYFFNDVSVNMSQAVNGKWHFWLL